MSTSPPSASLMAFQHRIERVVTMLMLLDPTPEVKTLTLEARRLRTTIRGWAAIPPSVETLEQMSFQLAEVDARLAPLVAGTPAVPDGSGDDGRVERGAGYSMAPNPSYRRMTVAPGITLTRPARLEWRPFSRLEGVAAKILRREPALGVYTALLRLMPGACVPRHLHRAPEQLYLVEGSALLSELELHPGDHLYSEPGSKHDDLTTTLGCTLLLLGSDSDELVAGVAIDRLDTLRPQ